MDNTSFIRNDFISQQENDRLVMQVEDFAQQLARLQEKYDNLTKHCEYLTDKNLQIPGLNKKIDYLNDKLDLYTGK